MHVVATAGHVDHGKSTLVRALTGMEPDRLAEEQRRGMTIDLGYAWTVLPGGGEIAFVDVPGHERFTTTMLAGVGPVPAVLLVVAADGGWAPQTAEHVRALSALGVRHGLLAVTRSDLADPAPATAATLAQLAGTTLAGIPAVAVSGHTGDGLADLRAGLAALVRGLPEPATEGRVRLWVDRAFTVRGSGTVVTGTLGEGRLRVGNQLELAGERVTIRGLESLRRPHPEVAAVARVAVNLRGVPRTAVRRGQALLTPAAWRETGLVDVRLAATAEDRLARQLVLHLGSAAVPVTVRVLDATTARLTLAEPLPLQVGDRALLRDPGLRRVVAGVVVLDPAAPGLQRRGGTRARLAALGDWDGVPDLAGEVRRRGVVPRELLRQLGVPPGEAGPAGAVEAAGWYVASPRWRAWGERLAEFAARGDGRLVSAGVAHADLVRALDLPDPALLAPLVAARPELVDHGGRVRPRDAGPAVAPALAAALRPILAGLAAAPFAAPEQHDLAAAGLGAAQLGAAAAAGLLLRLPGDVVLRPDAPARAAAALAGLPQPFTLSAARQALGTTRRVAVPLLEHLDRLGLTRRLDDRVREVRG